MDLYEQLAEHLDKLPIAFPRTDSGVELKILRRWFSEEEAGIALKMSGKPEEAGAIAQRLGMAPEALSQVLERMFDKGLIFRLARGDMRLYNLVPLAEGIWEFQLGTIQPEEVRLMKEYLDVFMEKSWYGTPTSQHRVIPISKSLSVEMETMPYEEAEKIIRSQSKIAVMECICRKQSAMIGKGCDHPLEVCMAFGTGAYYYLDRGLGREIDHEEALEILSRAMDAGLVLQPGNGQKVWSMCMCCGCACELLIALKKLEKPSLAAHSNFFARVSQEDCTACGLCEERCPMDAISVEDVASVNTDRCIGCGVCVGACEFDAVSLVRKERDKIYQPPKNAMEMQMQIAKERGLI